MMRKPTLIFAGALTGTNEIAIIDPGGDPHAVSPQSFDCHRCTGIKLTFVHASIVGACLEKLSKAVNALPIGLPRYQGVKLTPMPEFDKAGSMQAFVDDAVKKGARVVNESGGTGCETLFFPAVVYPVRPGMELYTKEQFGPVVPVCTYEDEQEFLDYVTQSSYGQQVSLFRP
jgi:glyceraldehyde-3-phosphate dehydrogenase (NADP+)